MQVEQLSVKFFARDAAGFDPGALIPVFHRFVREGVLENRLLIDVADYRHVDEGPGVMVVGHECHFGIDEENGRGLLYSRKRDVPGPVGEKLAEAWLDSVKLALLLEAEKGLGLTFDPGQVEVRVMSRRVARNTPETYRSLCAPLRAFLIELYGSDSPELAHLDSPTEPLGVRIRVAAPAQFRSILGHLQGSKRVA